MRFRSKKLVLRLDRYLKQCKWTDCDWTNAENGNCKVGEKEVARRFDENNGGKSRPAFQHSIEVIY